MAITHYRYGGSTWARTLACPGWRQLADRVIYRPGSQTAADRGTLLHAAIVEMYRSRLKAEAMVGFTCPEVTNQSVTSADAKGALIPAASALKRFLNGATPRFEVAVEYNALAGGTGDVVARYGGKLADFKFGSQRVRAKHNSQLYFYAAAYRWLPRFKVITLAVIQPGAHPVLDVTHVSRAQLDAYWRQVQAQLIVAEAAGAKLAKGEHCQYCPCKPICPAFNGDLKLLDPARFPRVGI